MGFATTQFGCGCYITRTMEEHKLWSANFCLKHRDKYWTPDLSTKDIADKIWEVQRKSMESTNE